MSKEEKKEKPPAAPITLEELFSAGKAHIKRTLVLELDDGKELRREVTFRRLSYKEIHDLSIIPREEAARYTKTTVFWSSIVPKFETVDQVDEAPNGFVQNYCNIILAESGKDPFLVKG